MARRKSSHSNEKAVHSRSPAIDLPMTETLEEYVALVLTMTEAACNAAELDFDVIRRQRTVEVDMPADIRDAILRHVRLDAELESWLASPQGESFELPLSFDDLAAICTALSASLETAGEDDEELPQVVAGMGECFTSALSEFLTELADEVAPPERSARGKRKSAAASTVYQLKITLAGVEPPVWRRVEVSDCSLAELHDVIQNVMGWEFSHLYCFEVGKRQYGSDTLDGVDEDDGEMSLSDLVESRTKKFHYTYDFGDDWEHEIKIEKTLAAESKVKYPRCTEGARACPPEDCGGAWGYENFLAAVRDPQHEEHGDMLEWCGGKFDPEAFDVKRVNKTLHPRK